MDADDPFQGAFRPVPEPDDDPGPEEGFVPLGALAPETPPAEVTELWPTNLIDATETAAAFCGREKLRSRPLLGPLLAEGQRMMVVAQTGHGKTTFILHLVRDAIRGNRFIGEWEGLEGGGGKALFIDLEQDEVTAELRLREAGLGDAEDIEYLHLQDGLNLRRDGEQRRAFEALIREGDYNVVVIDPLFKAFIGEDSNDESAAVACMAELDRLRMTYRFALIMGMHARKPTPKVRFSMSDAFGSTAWLRGAESIIGVERLGQGASRIINFKDRVGFGDSVDPPFPVDARLQLSYSRDWGFAFRMKDGDRPASLDAILRALEDYPDGRSIQDLSEATGLGQRTIQGVARRYLIEGDTVAGTRAKLWKWHDPEALERYEMLATEKGPNERGQE